MHGSNYGDIEEFEPRQANDTHEFGAQKAVYAAGDGLWAMFYAVLDRTGDRVWMSNACVRLETDGQLSEPYYYFSVTRGAKWRTGYVYVLPSDGFVQDPRGELGEYRFQIPHWASLKPVKPVAKFVVTPEDFPFLPQVREHDNEELRRRIDADPLGFPWADEQYQDRA